MEYGEDERDLEREEEHAHGPVEQARDKSGPQGPMEQAEDREGAFGPMEQARDDEERARWEDDDWRTTGRRHRITRDTPSLDEAQKRDRGMGPRE